MVLNLHQGDSIREVIRLENVSKSIGEKKILNSLNFSVGKGEIHSLIGPNGAGKTTTTRVILGLLKPTSGSVKVFGRDPLELEGRSKLISAVFERDVLWENLTGTHNIFMLASLYGLNSELALRKASQYAGILHIDKALSQPVHTFSKGMKRKLSIILGLIKDPDLLMLDEPNSGIDTESRIDIRNILIELKDAGKTIFLTSHDLDEVQKISSYTTIINKGKVILSGETEKIRGNQGKIINLVKNTESDLSSFLSFLIKKNYSYQSDMNKNNISIEVLDDKSVEEIIKTGIEMGLTVRSIENNNSLEDIYMKIIKEEEQNG